MQQLLEVLAAAGSSGAPAQPSFIGVLEGPATTDRGYDVAIDSTGNVYLCGTSGNYIQLAKYSSAGVLQWQRQLGSPASSFRLAVDASSNVFVFGSSTYYGYSDMQLAKYNSSGTLQWQRSLGTTTLARDDYGYGVAVGPSGNVYVCGSAFASQWQVTGYNTNGSLTWQVGLSGSGAATGIAVDASERVFVSGAASGAPAVARYDSSSGALQWQRSLTGEFVATNPAIAVDSNGSTYIATSVYNGTSYDIYLAKHGLTGTASWQRALGGSSYADAGLSVALDSDGYVYVCGYYTTGSGGYTTMQLAKYSTVGTLQWQRKLRLSGSGQSVRGQGIAVYGTRMYVCGYCSGFGGTEDILFASLPTDGSKEGTYTVGGQTFIYEASTLTGSTPALTPTTTTRTAAATSLTSAASLLTSSTSTLTSSVTTI